MTDVMEHETTASLREAGEAIVAARLAFADWARTPAAERAAALRAAAARLRAWSKALSAWC